MMMIYPLGEITGKDLHAVLVINNTDKLTKKASREFKVNLYTETTI